MGEGWEVGCVFASAFHALCCSSAKGATERGPEVLICGAGGKVAWGLVVLLSTTCANGGLITDKCSIGVEGVRTHAYAQFRR